MDDDYTREKDKNAVISSGRATAQDQQPDGSWGPRRAEGANETGVVLLPMGPPGETKVFAEAPTGDGVCAWGGRLTFSHQGGNQTITVKLDNLYCE